MLTYFYYHKDKEKDCVLDLLEPKGSTEPE